MSKALALFQFSFALLTLFVNFGICLATGSSYLAPLPWYLLVSLSMSAGVCAGACFRSAQDMFA